MGRTGEGVHSVELWQRSGKVFHHGDGGAIQTVFQVESVESHFLISRTWGGEFACELEKLLVCTGMLIKACAR